MLRLVKIITVILLVITVASPSFASETSPLWKNVGSWQIRVDETIGHGCFALAIYEKGTIFRIGFNPRKNYNGYFMLGDVRWKSLEVGKDYELRVQFDNEKPWYGDATGFSFNDDGLVFLWMDFDKPKFLDEFASKHKVEFKYNNVRLGLFTLRGSSKAVVELLRCQKAMKETGATNSSSDPFKSKKPKSDDPFAN